MVWLSVRDVMGLPPKQSRRMYSDTEMPAASACRISLSFSSALIRKVRRASKRPLPLLSSSSLSSFSLECEKRSAERSESRGEAFGRMLHLSSDRCHPARKNLPRGILRRWLSRFSQAFILRFILRKISIVKTTFFASRKGYYSASDWAGQIISTQKV